MTDKDKLQSPAEGATVSRGNALIDPQLLGWVDLTDVTKQHIGIFVPVSARKVQGPGWYPVYSAIRAALSSPAPIETDVRNAWTVEKEREACARLAETETEVYVPDVSAIDVRMSFQRTAKWKDGRAIASAIRARTSPKGGQQPTEASAGSLDLPVEGWLDIATAPKNGTPILLGWHDPNGEVCEGYWFDGKGNHWEEPGWRATDDDILTSHAMHPTHWMPRPKPPAQAALLAAVRPKDGGAASGLKTTAEDRLLLREQAQRAADKAKKNERPTATFTGQGLLDLLDDFGTLLMLSPVVSPSAPATSPSEKGETLQQRVQPWMMACFGPEIAGDKIERNHRFLEEALELVQACGCPQFEAHQLVDYVYGRDQGDINQEVGGVMITLAALCLANGFDMHAAGETELARIWTKIDKIRAKQAAKPRGSALPIAPSYSPERGKATGEQT